MPEIPYLANIGEQARSEVARRLPDVAANLQQKGYWQDVVEWRISTETVSRIEPEQIKGRRWYRVSVSCDAELVCHAPTLERALEYLGIFETLTRDMFWSLGWPSWAAKTRPEPSHGERTP
ncbi:MAG TPA: hypothetical protein VE990_17045 [Acidimicrobiales bacterium]|nr:hypothetical protein [Acidimicrobiales bacterium]